MSRAPYAWEPLFARAEAKVSSFDPTGLDDAVASLSDALEPHLHSESVEATEMKALVLRLQQFLQQCSFIKRQLAFALSHAATAQQPASSYTRSGKHVAPAHARAHAYLRRLA